MDKYERILQELRRRIETGEFREDDRIPTEAELCRQYAVSRITAMRAVKELQSAGLVRRVSGRGTFVMRPPTREKPPFHLIVPGLKVRYYDLLVEAFCSFFRERNLICDILCCDYYPEYTARLLRSIAATGSSGLAIVPAPDKQTHKPLRQQLAAMTIPTVILSRELPEFSVPQIVVDEEAAGFMAATYLLEHGHRRFLYLGPAEDEQSASIIRYRGVRRALKEQAPEAELQALENIDSVMLPQIREIFSGNTAPSAVIAADDSLSAGAYDLLKALDRAPGVKTAVFGLDGGLLALALETPLTTVEFPGGCVGAEAAATLYALAEGTLPEEARRVVRLAPQLIARSSCGESKKVYRHEYLRELIRESR